MLEVKTCYSNINYSSPDIQNISAQSVLEYDARTEPDYSDKVTLSTKAGPGTSLPEKLILGVEVVAGVGLGGSLIYSAAVGTITFAASPLLLVCGTALAVGLIAASCGWGAEQVEKGVNKVEEEIARQRNVIKKDGGTAASSSGESSSSLASSFSATSGQSSSATSASLGSTSSSGVGSSSTSKESSSTPPPTSSSASSAGLSSSSSAASLSSSASGFSSSAEGSSSTSTEVSSSSSVVSSSAAVSSSAESFPSSIGVSSSGQVSSSSAENLSSSYDQDAGTPTDAGAVDAAIVCSPLPSQVGLTTPLSGAANISVHPSFGWTVVAGQGISYALQADDDLGFNSPEINQINLPTNQYTATETLANNTTYFWRVNAQDSCLNSVSSATGNFTTERLCTQHTYFNNDFPPPGTVLNTVVNSGTITLAKDQSVWNCYDGDFLPETVGWTETAPIGWTTKSSGAGVLELNTEDNNQAGYFERSPLFSSTTGWMLDSRLQLVNSQGGSACSIRIQDDNYDIDFRFLNDRIADNNTGGFYMMDPRVAFNVYRVTAKDGNYEVSVNGTVRVSGLAAANTATSYLKFHDPVGLYDSHAFWDYLCYYNGGNTLPYVASGTYTSEIIDTEFVNNNIGSGAMIIWSQATPANTSIEMQACASNDSQMLIGVNCESGLVNNAGEIISPTVSGQFVRFVATLNTLANQLTPQLNDVTIRYETCE